MNIEHQGIKMIINSIDGSTFDECNDLNFIYTLGMFHCTSNSHLMSKSF